MNKQESMHLSHLWIRLCVCVCIYTDSEFKEKSWCPLFCVIDRDDSINMSLPPYLYFIRIVEEKKPTKNHYPTQFTSFLP